MHETHFATQCTTFGLQMKAIHPNKVTLFALTSTPHWHNAFDQWSVSHSCNDSWYRCFTTYLFVQTTRFSNLIIGSQTNPLQTLTLIGQ